ncbi:MAG: helix-turn-helix domain-containing protein [Lutibacter sp.]|nr:transcriptional regulator [Lutibacter sp.]
MSNVSQLTQIKKCSGEFVLAINDTMNVLNGKWKLPIIGSLLYGKKRFKELEREIPKITPRMLSKELKDLEINSIITRTVQSTIPVKVEYELSASGRSLNAVLDAMITWGKQHRERVIGKNQKISEDVED